MVYVNYKIIQYFPSTKTFSYITVELDIIILPYGKGGCFYSIGNIDT